MRRAHGFVVLPVLAILAVTPACRGGGPSASGGSAVAPGQPARLVQDAAVEMTPPPPPPPTATAALALAVELSVTPAVLTATTREALRLDVTVRNLGTDTVDPEINLSRLEVNGVASKAWNMALGNSGRPRKWKALPAGDSVTGGVTGLADDLFPGPGDYTLVLTVSGVAAPAVDVRVTR